METAKCSNENFKIFKTRLKSISRYAFLNFEDECDNNLVIDTFLISNPDGLAYIKKNAERFGVFLSFDEDGEDKAYKFLVKYFNGEIPDNLILTVNGYNKKVIAEVLDNGFSEIYSAYGFEYSGQNQFEISSEDLDIRKYEAKHSEQFIDLLGNAFYDLRKEVDLKPYNWYLENKKASEDYFLEKSKTDSIIGLWQENSLIGVIILDDNEIDTIAVDRRLQGMGYGDKLLRYTMNELINNKHFDTVYLAVMAHNKKAIKMYKKSGFIEKSKLSYFRLG